VSLTLGKGRRGIELWKLYNPGLFHFLKTVEKS
jgi:hypothetical protein